MAKRPELIPNKIVTEIEQAEEAEMGNPVPSQEKLEQLASWLTPELEKHALEIANLAMIGKIRAGENLSEVKAKHTANAIHSKRNVGFICSLF